VTAWLDSAIERASGSVGDFLSELKRMIEHVRPAALDEARSSASADGRVAEVELVHAERPDWSVWAEAREDEIVVGVAELHEHFGAEWSADGERPFTTVAVDFIAELLRGEVEITTTYRGGTPAAVSHRLVDRPEPLGHTGTIAALMFWRPKRTTVERVSFDARG
jgi:hypothetical protein